MQHYRSLGEDVCRAEHDQPFWALPILCAFKITFKDILPCTFIGWVWMFVAMTLSVFILP